MNGTTTGGIFGPHLNAASFWLPNYLSKSAWLEHVPFAFWLITSAKPSSIVELGTHTGLSYFAFCQAVATEQLPTRCHAVDTWQGDEHAGAYGEDIFTKVRTHNAAHYSGFSKLLRRTFQEALIDVEDGSVDLLHVDGRHFYDDVREDFTSWERKLSPRAIVLFHDTQVFERGFGVHRYWNEIRSGKPSFEFHHGHGLGVLGYGSDFPSELASLFAASDDPEAAEQIRAAYARLGAGIAQTAKVNAIRDDWSSHPARKLNNLVRVTFGKKPRRLRVRGWTI